MTRKSHLQTPDYYFHHPKNHYLARDVANRPYREPPLMIHFPFITLFSFSLSLSLLRLSYNMHLCHHDNTTRTTGVSHTHAHTLTHTHTEERGLTNGIS